ncbi:hypothetical protein AMTRI_Chr08g204780 [Amborella trichopoda]
MISSLVKVGTFKILKKINYNAYKLKLPSHICTSNVFNVKHLIPYHGDTSDDEPLNLRANSFEEGRTDIAQKTALEYQEKRDKLKVHKRYFRRDK